jgi:hypothetical protein
MTGEEAADLRVKIAEIERLFADNAGLRAVEARAKLVIKEWRSYGGYKPPMIDQLVALEELIARRALEGKE